MTYIGEVIFFYKKKSILNEKRSGKRARAKERKEET